MQYTSILGRKVIAIKMLSLNRSINAILITCCELYQKQLIPVFLKIPLKCVSTADKQVVDKHDNGLVVHLFEAAINRLL